MDLKDLVNAHKALITERLDPDFGLLDELIVSRSLTTPEVARVKAVPDSYGRSDKLLEYVFERDIYEAFLNALRDTQQTHLANYIRSNGEHRPEFGDDWPLTEREISILDTNRRSLVDLLETSDLIPHIYSHKVINNRQRDFVSSKIVSHEKNDALLEILRRTSIQDYKKTIRCLRLSEQNHIAMILEEGGGFVRARLELETDGDVNEVEDELITKFTEMLGHRSLGDSARILECTQLRLIAAKKGNSVILYFFCKTLTELIQLQEIQTSGKLANIVEKMFNEMLSSARIINLRISLYHEDFSKCELYFRRIGSKCEVEEKCDENDRSSTSETTIHDLPLELLDVILGKVYGLSGVFGSRIAQTTDEEIIRNMASVDYCWFQRVIRRRRFKNVIWRKLRDAGAKGKFEESCDVHVDEGSATSNTAVFKRTRADDTPEKAEDQLREITECPICMGVLTDPRVLSCIHTFCFQCLKHTSEAMEKKPGDKMPCPLCQTEFIIPEDGVNGVQKNVFVENLLAVKAAMQTGKSCTKHIHEPLNLYCADCKKTVCVLCFFENHRLHGYKYVTNVDKEFRKTIEKKAMKISTFTQEMLLMKTNNEKRKSDFFKEIDDTEKEIHERSQELKDMIDRHTRLLLDELAVIKSKHLKKIDNQMEEIERYCTVFRSFEVYCRELSLKGSASDICSSVGEIIVRADELEKEQKELMGRLHQSVQVSFHAKDLGNVSPNTYINFVGAVEETNAQYANFALIVGLNEGINVTRDIVKISLNQLNEITTEGQVPTRIWGEAFATVYDNTTYVTGIGVRKDEIWKYKNSVSWKQCASLVEGRRRHSTAFIDEVLYICGGFVDSTRLVLDSVEAYNTSSNKCTTVGKLVHCVQNSGNCVPFKGSLYIFCGADKDYFAFNHVQVYNTKDNTCSVISKPMPRPSMLMRAALWETSVILLGHRTCYIFNIETETWQERHQFKTDVFHFGLVLENERVFVIGGGNSEKNKDGKAIWTCRGDVRYVPLKNILDDKPIEWKIHGKLPKPCLVHAYANIRQLRPLATYM